MAISLAAANGTRVAEHDSRGTLHFHQRVSHLLRFAALLMITVQVPNIDVEVLSEVLREGDLLHAVGKAPCFLVHEEARVRETAVEVPIDHVRAEHELLLGGRRVAGGGRHPADLAT